MSTCGADFLHKWISDHLPRRRFDDPRPVQRRCDQCLHH
ncbi:DUF768 domain-containing protein [Mesorhizobium sp. B2-3-5]|nr:DUF768 domain-containing protein [Mesorhizobium sp. B2-3-5]